MRRALPWILLVLTLCWCVVIWQFSLRPASESAETSSATLDQVNEVLESVGLPLRFDHHTIRKTAHFAEFFALGVLSAATLVAFGFSHGQFLAPVAALLVACVDEILQIFSPGRGPSILDVLLDAAGGICGSIAFFLVFWLALYLRERRGRKKSEINEKNA